MYAHTNTHPLRANSADIRGGTKNQCPSMCLSSDRVHRPRARCGQARFHLQTSHPLWPGEVPFTNLTPAVGRQGSSYRPHPRSGQARLLLQTPHPLWPGDMSPTDLTPAVAGAKAKAARLASSKLDVKIRSIKSAHTLVPAEGVLRLLYLTRPTHGGGWLAQAAFGSQVITIRLYRATCGSEGARHGPKTAGNEAKTAQKRAKTAPRRSPPKSFREAHGSSQSGQGHREDSEKAPRGSSLIHHEKCCVFTGNVRERYSERYTER